MVCAWCKTTNSTDAVTCSTCGVELDESTRLVSEAQQESNDDFTRVVPRSGGGADERTNILPEDDGATIRVPADQSESQASSSGSRSFSTFLTPLQQPQGTTQLQPGMLLNSRYEIIRSIGEGGMGSVYEAHDQEVDRKVAIKVIRPELASDGQILQRFKQELVLARQVTHRNVVRIYDLGVNEHLKFISMEFIEGRELGEVLEECGRLEPKRAAEIMLQVSRGLEAAHEVGVIHRDLKPQNIMLDSQGRAAVMDFGIAYSLGSAENSAAATQSTRADTGLTQMGALLGTPRYMSPEQAKSEPIDARSDIFTVGLILYQLLTGVVPFAAKTRKETLRKRIDETAKPLIELNPKVPKALNQIVMKCLERERENRYQTITQLIHDLEVWLGIRSTDRAAQLQRTRRTAAGLAVLVLAAGGFITWNQMRIQANKPHPLVKVLLSDFQNKTGQAVLSGTLEPVMRDALERASFISVYSPGSAKRLAAKLRPGSTQLDESLARLVALREGVGVVVTGGIDNKGSGYRVWVKEINPTKGDTILSDGADVSGTRELPQALEKLGARIRRSLGDQSGTPKNLAEETFTSASLEAAQQYSAAQDLSFSGKWDESIAAYRKAIAIDPGFSRAYSGLAVTLANLGKRQEAEKYYKLALAHIDRMSEREKYRTRGGYYLLMRDYQKAGEQYRALVNQYPADSVGLANLALANFYGRNMEAALIEAQRAMEIYPENLALRNNLALYAMYAGDFDRAIKESLIILQKNPSFEKAYVCLAMSYLAKGDEAQAQATYEKLSKLSKWGESEAALGLSDMAIYSGKPAIAAVSLQKGIQYDLANKDTAAAALKSVVLAELEANGNKRQAALASAGIAAQPNNDDSVRYAAAHVYVEMGETNKALQIADDLSNRFEPEPRALSKLIGGEVKLKAGKFAGASFDFQDAQKLADSWLARFDLGRAYLAAGSYPDADNEFDVCLKRKGEATSVFLDDDPTLRYIPPAYYYEGRARQGLQSPSASDFYKTYLNIRHNNVADPLVVDAQRRLKASQ